MPGIRTDADAKPPAPMSFADLGDIIDVTDLCKVTRLDKKTVLKAIHAGQLPAWFPGGNATLGEPTDHPVRVGQMNPIHLMERINSHSRI